MHQPYATSTGSKAAGGQTVALECALTAVELISDGTNACNIQVYDGISAAAPAVLLADIHIPASTVAPTVITFNTPVYCNRGIFTVLTGTDATFLLHYIVI